MTKELLESCNELKHVLSQLNTFENVLLNETKHTFKDLLLVGIKDETIVKIILTMRDALIRDMQTSIKSIKGQLENEFDKL